MADEIQKQHLASLDIGTPSLEFREPPPRWMKICGLVVHFYTASGALIAFLIVLAAIRGNAVQALWLALVALIIDGTDGWLARRFHVKETLPWFDGRRLDDIVDYLTYVFAPILLLWNTGHLPTGTAGIILAALPLLASGYQFCRVDAKTDDRRVVPDRLRPFAWLQHRQCDGGSVGQPIADAGCGIANHRHAASVGRRRQRREARGLRLSRRSGNDDRRARLVWRLGLACSVDEFKLHNLSPC